jgi:hypothetical protein
MLAFCYLNYYDPNAQHRNMLSRPLTENCVGRCELCGAPVAKGKGMRFRYVQLPETNDMSDHVFLTAEEAEGREDVKIAAIGSNCYRREKDELAPYAMKPSGEKP